VLLSPQGNNAKEIVPVTEVEQLDNPVLDLDSDLPPSVSGPLVQEMSLTKSTQISLGDMIDEEL
jgi:hypothetical protein